VTPAARTGEWRRARLADAPLYLCCGLDAGDGDLPGFLDRVLEAGVDLVQLRDKHAGEDELVAGAQVFRAAAHRHGALFVLNDEPLFAADAGADGVHVGQDDAPVIEARRAVGRDRLVGLSTHSAAEVDGALQADCDYFAVGPVHATPTKESRAGIGTLPIRHAAAVADRPWFVTGDMRAGTAPEVLAMGAPGIVVVRAITAAGDPAAAAAELSAMLRRWRSGAPSR
jgi:thiamine-phosphate pyrophosphorylase